MDRLTNNSLPLIGVAIIVALIMGSIIAINRTTPASITTQPTSTADNSKPLQLKTFYLDEYNDPLVAESAAVAIDRNEARIDLITEQIGSDLTLIDQLNESL